jgi:hypothetical protein
LDEAKLITVEFKFEVQMDSVRKFVKTKQEQQEKASARNLKNKGSKQPIAATTRPKNSQQVSLQQQLKGKVHS